MKRFLSDAGHTLTELLVVLSLLGITLGAAYMFVYSARAQQAGSDREAKLSRAVSMPLLTMERLLVQNSAIDPLMSPSHYSVTIITDQNYEDALLEQHTFVAVRDATTGAGYVDSISYFVNAAGARVGAAKQNGHIAYDNSNLADGVPLFLYYDKDGVEITDMGAVSSRARSIVVQIRTTVDGKSETHADTVTFRNRQ